MASSSTPTLADFSTLLAQNLVNIEQQPPLLVSAVLAPYKTHFRSEYEWMCGCIETYGKLACNETATYTGILSLISAISGGAYYVDECNGLEYPLNLYVHIIGEPGSGKSTPVNYIKAAICQLIDLFPDLYNKKINTHDNIGNTMLDVTTALYDNPVNSNHLHTINKSQSNHFNKKKSVEERMKIIVNFDTELALFRQMALIGDLFAITDELDSQLVRLGVFKSNDDTAAPGAKFLTQAYDGIHNESRGTGTSKYVIISGKLAIFGASTGQRYALNMRNFAQNIGNDGVLVRMSYLVMPHGGAKPISNRIPISMPNALHVAVVISLLINAGYPVQLRFEKLQSDIDNEPPCTLPLYQRERRSFIDGNVLPSFYELVPSENTLNGRRNIDIEPDGSTLSANSLLTKLIKEDVAKSEDANRPLHVRALYAKTPQKLSRIVANTHLYFVAIHLLTSNDYDLFNYVSFREGSGTANSIVGVSTKFLEAAKNVVNNYMKMHFKTELVKVGENEIIQGKFIIDVTKEAVLAGYSLFKYIQDVQLAIFDLSGLSSIVKNRLSDSTRKIDEIRKQLALTTTQQQDSDTGLIFKLPSPILKRVWITNKKDAPSWAGIFCQSSKKSTNSRTTERGTKAVDALIECGLFKQTNYLPNNSALWKATPMDISRSEQLQAALYKYVGIHVNEYEKMYEDWFYPSDLTIMTRSLIDHLIGAPEVYARYYHNYSPEKYPEFRLRIQQLEHDGLVRKMEVNGRIIWHYCINDRNPFDYESNDYSSSCIINQTEIREIEAISTNEHGLKRKLTTLVKRNEVIISPSTSFSITPTKRTHVQAEVTPDLEPGIVNFQNLLSSNNNTFITSYNNFDQNEQNATNNITFDKNKSTTNNSTFDKNKSTTTNNTINDNITNSIHFTSISP
ncbi:unnamed protein product, partial [Rotaria sp. Silwood1]